MQSELSIELPDSIANLVSQQAFENYTTGGASSKFKSQLDALDKADIFPNGINDEEMADCCLSGLWLLHNFLDRSHDISQEVHTAEGSFWHAIMHRLEGDFWNSKYWYRKARQHPCFDVIQKNWDPESFVDQCEAAQQSGSMSQVQPTAIAEWKALFEYCFVNA